MPPASLGKPRLWMWAATPAAHHHIEKGRFTHIGPGLPVPAANLIPLVLNLPEMVLAMWKSPAQKSLDNHMFLKATL